jgi:hypothetical protein
MGRHCFFLLTISPLKHFVPESGQTMSEANCVFEENRLHQGTMLPATAFTYACFCVSNPKTIYHEFKCQIQGSPFPSVSSLLSLSYYRRPHSRRLPLMPFSYDSSLQQYFQM